MKHLSIFFSLLLLVSFQLYSQNTSTSDGTWGAGSTWIGGSSPGFTNLANTTINSYVTASAGISFEAVNTRTLTINDTLVVYGDVTFASNKNNATITIGANNVLIILGNLNLGKNTAGVTIAAGGVLIVNGTIQASGVESNSSITGAGEVYSPNSSGVTATGSGGGGISPITDLTGDGFPELEEFVEENGDDPLPVELLFFNAQSKKEIILSWATATELNNDHFIIERSDDGSHFYEIGQVKGSGTTSEENHYTFSDKFPLTSIEYYRLTQFDYDGKSETFETLRVETEIEDLNEHIIVYPTIVNGGFITLKSTSPFQIREINLYSIDGKTARSLLQESTPENPLTYYTTLQNLSPGNYLIKVTTTAGKTTSSQIRIK